MPKRRHGRLPSADSSESSFTTRASVPDVKKRKKSAQQDPDDAVTQLCQELYDTIRNYKTPEGHLVCETFIRVPKRRTCPDYYNVVSEPIDLLKIQQKLKTDEYETVEQLTEDIGLLVNNAKAYYKKCSTEYIDACQFWEVYSTAKENLLAAVYGETPPAKDTEEELESADDTEEDEGEDEEEEEEEEEGEDEDEDAEEEEGEDEEEVENREEEEEEEEEEAPPQREVDEELDNQLEQLFAAVMTAKSGDRNISEPFQLLPSKSKYREYYDIIKDPMDLRTIAQRIQNREYSNLDELEKDLQLMVKNARTFNEPGSMIYKDAVMLKKLVIQKKNEILNEGMKPPREPSVERKVSERISDSKEQTVTPKTSERIILRAKNPDAKSSERSRSKRKTGAQRLSAICAALNYQSEEDASAVESDIASCHDNISQMDFEDESGGEGSVAEGEDNVQWMLYNSVKNLKNSLGQSLSEPFMKLPSKRIYPDYYDEIDHPISMTQIKKKIQKKKYSRLEDVAADFDLLFRNAQQYNVDESRLFKDAQQLQKVVKKKKKELEKLEVKEILEGYPPVNIDEKEIDQDTEDDVPDKPRRSRKSASNMQAPPPPAPVTTPPEDRKKTRQKIPSYEESLKQRLNLLYDILYNYEEEGRTLINIFIELPSDKIYPDYYQVISEPIDMNMIRRKIDENEYQTEHDLVADFKLMFGNARHYNEENSLVYQDAETLEKVLKNKLKTLTPLTPLKQRQGGKPLKGKGLSPLAQKLQELYDHIKDYTDGRGRDLAPPFMKLPSKQEYPNYYEIIKKPIDMQKIHQRMTSNQYESIEDMVSDYVMMFDNACKFNEPESQIYKDALTLQRVCLEKKTMLADDEDLQDIPDVRALIQELMTNLFISVYNSQDEEGRCYSDSFLELPAPEPTKEGDTQAVRGRLTFDQIKRNLDKSRYRRLDRFQEDMFEVFEHARKVSRTDSQLYEDSVEMQMFFIKIRDELCKNGELLLTPALSYTERHLQAALDEEKKEKLPKEQAEDEEKKKQDADGKKDGEKSLEDGEDSIDFGDKTYHIGDFVYIEPREKGLEPHIVCIEKLWTDKNKDTWLHGCWFYRPGETFHLATRKFLEKEVFKSDFNDSVPLNNVIGKCFVMFVKDYFKHKPEAFPDKDVYVCESRYSAKQKAFKKIKVWQMPKNDAKIVIREHVLTPVRVESVFADGAKGPEGKDNEAAQVLDKKRNTVVQENQPAEDGNTYYDQIVGPFGAFKLGDCVYVKTSINQRCIAKIEKLWTDQNGVGFFHGPRFLYPIEVEHPPTRLFYMREVFMNAVEETHPLITVCGKCAVLWYKDFCTNRPTEIPENDVYICESRYQDSEKSIRKISKGFKRIAVSPKVTDDEIYFFRKSVTPKKVPSPHLLQVEEQYEESVAEDDSNMATGETESGFDIGFLGFGTPQEDYGTPMTPLGPETEKKKKKRNRKPTGYIIFAAECRKKIKDANPELSFGELSREVGTEWRNLDKETKEIYEEKAKKLAAEQAAKQAEAEKAMNESLRMHPPQAQSPASDFGRMSPAASGRPITPGSGHYPQGMHPQQMQGGYPPGYGQYQQNMGQMQYQRGHPQMGMMQPHPSQTPQRPGMPHQPGMMGMPQQHPGMPQQGHFPNMQTPPQHPQFQMHQQGQMHPQQGQMHPQQGQIHPQQGQMQGQMHQPMPGPGFSMPPQQRPQQMPVRVIQHQGQLVNGQMPSGQIPMQPQQQPIRPIVPQQPGIASAAPEQANRQALPPPPPPKPPSPMFVTVPPRTQRLLHSEAYLKYIEGLSAEKRNVSDWDKHLSATPENTPLPQGGRLPVQWLGKNGVGPHGNAVNALWALRNLMLKDAVGISSTNNY